MLCADTRSIVESFLDFETLVSLRSKQAVHAFDPKNILGVGLVNMGFFPSFDGFTRTKRRDVRHVR